MMTPPTAPIHHHLNLTGQNVLTYASWVLTAVLLLVAYRMSRKERTPFYVCLVLASMVGAFAEPLYDEMFSLYFYSGKHMQTTFTAFGIPQPVWAYSGYALLYAAPALAITHRIRHGRLTAQALWGFAGIEVLMSWVFEFAGINMGTYTYWGPHVFRIFHYPIVIAILEAAQVMTFSIVAAHLRERSREGWHSIGLFWIFPVTMVGANFGAGVWVILAIHADHPDADLIRVATIASIIGAAALVKLLSGAIPQRAADATTSAPTGRKRLVTA